MSRTFGGGLRAGMNLGYRLRERRVVLDLEMDDEVFGQAGVAYAFGRAGSRPFELGVTASAATAAAGAFSEFNVNHAEVKTGLSVDLPGPALAFAGLGMGVAAGYGTPDWRGLIGLRLVRDFSAAPVARRLPSDRDGDGLVDPEDGCPDRPEDVDGFADLDGCPDRDDDRDGIPDASDRCRLEPEDRDQVDDQDGCPEIEDGDGDGVADPGDRCPAQAGAADRGGCPEAGPAPVADTGLDNLEPIHFGWSEALLIPESHAKLDAIAARLLREPSIERLRIEGHTDSEGDDDHNRQLAQRRADVVAAYLISKGVDASRLEAIGVGEERPIADNHLTRGRAANRRVEFRIVRPGP